MRLSQKPRAPENEALASAESLALIPEALDALRLAITIFDRDMKLVYVNRHFNYLYRSMPARETLLGASYEDMIRLEILGGEVDAKSIPSGIEAYVARRHAHDPRQVIGLIALNQDRRVFAQRFAHEQAGGAARRPGGGGDHRLALSGDGFRTQA